MPVLGRNWGSGVIVRQDREDPVGAVLDVLDIGDELRPRIDAGYGEVVPKPLRERTWGIPFTTAARQVVVQTEEGMVGNRPNR